jgi:N utilization substance protein A
MISDVKRIVEQVSRERGIDRKVLIATLEEALKSAARKKFGINVEIEVGYNDELGEIEVFQFKEVVEKVESPDLQLSLGEALGLDPESEVGDSLGVKIDINTFGRIAAQSAKQVIIQKMKDAERDVVYEDFIGRKGELINGIVQRIEKGNIIVNLGRTEGIVPVREQAQREYYRRGDRIRTYVLDVLRDTKGPQVILSRSHPNFLVMLFKAEVPEISEGIVEIMGAAREPGNRAKIAVVSRDSDIDPVGACVGMKGSRVQSVVQELRGEKIDIIAWHADVAKFVCNALAPAEISRVIVDENNKTMEVIVPDEFLSVAIGKGGQNVRLASKLTGWRIDVKSEEKYSDALRTGYESLLALPGMEKEIADALYEAGCYSIEELRKATADELVQIKGIDTEKAEGFIEAAKEMLQEGAKETEPAEETDVASESEPSVDTEEAEPAEETGITPESEPSVDIEEAETSVDDEEREPSIEEA